MISYTMGLFVCFPALTAIHKYLYNKYQIGISRFKKLSYNKTSIYFEVLCRRTCVQRWLDRHLKIRRFTRTANAENAQSVVSSIISEML